MQQSWDISEIRGLNPLMEGQRRGQIDHLIGIAATNEDLLCEMADLHESLDEDCVLCFFQLPFPIENGGDVIVLPALTHSVSVEARIFPIFLICDIRGDVSISREEPIGDDIWAKRFTQVIFKLPVWGKRALFYDAYTARVSISEAKDEVIVPAHESWIMDRALKTNDFEYNLVRRMLPEVLYAVRIFLKAIRVTTLYHCNHDYHFSNMFWMPSPGRVTYTQPPRPIIGELLGSSREVESVLIPDLTNAIRHRHRDVTKFERSLISFESLRRQGEVKSALIGIIAVIESTLKERFSAKGSLFKLLQDERLKILKPEDIAVINELRTARNAIIHEYMSSEQSTSRSFVTAKDLKILNNELDALCLRGIAASRQIYKCLNLSFSPSDDI